MSNLNITSGLYLLEVSSNNGTKVTKLLVK